MGNPKAPTRLPIDAAERSRRDLDHFLTRLRRLGLDDEGLRDVEENWDNFDDDWTPESRYALVRASDGALGRMLRARADEYEEGTVPEEVSALRRRADAVASAEIEANDKLNGTVAEVLAWVGNDPIRAMAAGNLERGPDGASRKTLLAELDRIIDGSA